jgi:hypothetical protein
LSTPLLVIILKTQKITQKLLFFAYLSLTGAVLERIISEGWTNSGPARCSFSRGCFSKYIAFRAIRSK